MVENDLDSIPHLPYKFSLKRTFARLGPTSINVYVEL